MDNDTPGVAERTLEQVRSWPPGLPVFGQLTPFPSTPLYKRLEAAGRLTRPTHWMDFAPFQMAHTPLKLTVPEAQIEVDHAWSSSYSPAATARAIDAIADKPFGYRLSHLIARLCFRGIYFPQMNAWSWIRVVGQNRRVIARLSREGVNAWRGARRARRTSGDEVVV